jgi:hypothetical protein
MLAKIKRLWSDRKDWRIFIHQPTYKNMMLSDLLPEHLWFLTQLRMEDLY